MTTTPPDHVLVPRVPTEAMWSGLARDIVMWSRWGSDATGEALHAHLRRLGRDIPDWLVKEIPPTPIVPAKGDVAVAIYRAMLADAPSPPTSGGVNAGLLKALRQIAAYKKPDEVEDVDEPSDATYETVYGYLITIARNAIATAESAQAATAGESARANAITSPSAMENGWVIEHRNSPRYEPRYWTGNGWSKDNLAAIRFAREIDAQNTANGFDEDDPLPSEGEHRIAEHGWG